MGVTLTFPFQFQYQLKNQFEPYTIAICYLRTANECVVVCCVCATLMDWLRVISLINEIVLQLARAGEAHIIHSTMWFLLYTVNTTQNKQSAATAEKNIELKKKQATVTQTNTMHTVNN